MLAEEDLFSWEAEVRLQTAGDAKLRGRPAGHQLGKKLARLRIRLQNTGDDAAKFAEGLFVEDGVVELRAANSGGLEAKLNRLRGKIVVVLDAGEAFFLSGSDQLAVAEQCRGCVMVIAGNSQYVHELVLLGARPAGQGAAGVRGF